MKKNRNNRFTGHDAQNVDLHSGLINDVIKLHGLCNVERKMTFRNV